MAVSRYVPKDIKKYHPKTFWGFSGREIASLIIAFLFIFITYKILKSCEVGTEACIYICSIPAIFPILVGFVKPYGIPLEKFLPQLFTDMFVHKQKRFRITAPSLSLVKEKTPVKLNPKNKPLAIIKKK